MSTARKETISVYPNALELAMIIKQDPSVIEKSLLAKGAQIIAVYIDPNFKDTFQNYHDLKLETLRMAIEDIAIGAPTLRNSSVGLTYKSNRVEPYIAPHGILSPGNTMYSINLKDSVAFKHYRFNKNEELPEEIVNAGIYYLTVLLSKLI